MFGITAAIIARQAALAERQIQEARTLKEQGYSQADMATKTRIGSMYQQDPKAYERMTGTSLGPMDKFHAEAASLNGRSNNPDSLSALMSGLDELNNNLNHLRALSADVADTLTGAFPTEGEASKSGEYYGMNGLVATAMQAVRQANKRVEQIAAEIQRVKYAL